ncbi:MAG: GAF domain-containing protein [Rhodoferax sp.]|nr:GAF domain-containing protein [Rhodoferax sp.]
MDAFDETGFSSATYKVLYQIAEGATRDESLFEFGCSLHRLLGELIPAKNLYLCLLSNQPGRLNFPYYVDERDGDSMQEMDVPMRKGLTEFVLRSGVTELISQERYLALQRSGDITEATGDLSFNSWLGVPLHIDGRVGGVLTVQSYESDVEYQPSDAHLLSFVARHVSTVIERKQSFDVLRAAHIELERETKQRRQSETLYRVFYQLAVQAAQGDSLHHFCAKVHELLGQLVLAPNCYISLCDVVKGVKHFPYYVDERDGETLQKTDVPLRNGLTEYVLSTDRPQRIDQVRLAQLQADGSITQAQGDLSFTAWLGVPLHIRGSADGVMAVQSYSYGASYTEGDAEVLAHVAHHVSGAIARMQAFEAVHRSELALRRTTYEREAMLNTALVGISFNVKERIVWVNEKCAEIAGFQREELMGQSPRIFYESDEIYLAEKAKSEASLRNCGTYSGERYTRRQNGERIWVLLAGRCVENNDPDAGVIWTLLDVTTRRQAEDDIRQALERQRELNVLRSRFVAMTSHEFRTPLASILSSAELLRYYSDRVSATERDSLLQSIETGVQRMTLMLDRILLIGKAEADMLEFSPKPLDLRALCELLIQEAALQHAEIKNRIVLDWQANPGLQGFDEKLCRHIFSNLLSNALKYSPAGGAVQFRIYSAGGHTVFEVQDQGIGIPADELHHLFDSFHRATNVGAIAGTGLGLSIVKKSVELHGGTITVRSKIGEGSCFTVTL